MRIAIDGPSGSGKSVLAKGIAKKYNIVYVDTGALYRAVGLFVMRRGIDKFDSVTVVGTLANISISLEYSAEEGQKVMLCGENVNDYIRTPEVSLYASAVSAIPQVREFLLGTQQDIIAANSVVMDGRDIGTVIMPNADVKFFLTADVNERAHRRHAELIARGLDDSYEQVLADMKTRDHNDSTRENAPAVAANDAIILDNTGYKCEQTLDKAVKIIEERLGLQ